MIGSARNTLSGSNRGLIRRNEEWR